MIRKYKKELVVMCFTSTPVNLDVFCLLRGKLLQGYCKDNHSNMYIKRVDGKYYHIVDEYDDNLIWYKTIKSDGGLMGVDEDFKDEFEIC